MDTVRTMDASEVASGSIYLTVQSMFINLVGVFGLTYLARVITIEQMGMLTALTLVNSFIQSVFDFGLTASLPKFISELKGRGEDASTHILGALVLKIPATFLPCLVIFIFSANMSSVLFGVSGRYDLVRLAILDSFIFALTPVFHSILLGAGRMRRIAVSGVFAVIIRWLVIVFLLINGYGFYGAVIGWISGDLVLLLLYVAASIRLLKHGKNLFHQSISLVPSILKFSWPLFVAAIVTFIYTWYDRAIILAFLPLTDLGIYDVSYKAFTVLTSLATALGSALYPFYGMAYGKKAHKAIASGLKRATRYTAIIIFPLTLGLLSMANPVIILFAGQQYESGWSILTILAAFGLVYGLLPAFTGLLVIYEKTKTVLLLSIVPVIASLNLLPLLYYMGLNGLAIMRGVSLLVTLLLTMFFISRIIKIEFDKQTILKALFSSTLMATVVLAAQQIRYSMVLFPIYVLMGAATYIGCIRFLKVLNESDIQLLEHIIGKRMVAILVKVVGYNKQEKETQYHK
jgi:O-antigen/teichoic acid export membrane protein